MSDVRICFVGSVIPEADCPANPVADIAGNKFQKNFIKGLRDAASTTIDVVTYIPAAMFPRGSRVWYGREVLEIEEGVQWARTIPFTNLPILKQVTQALSILAMLAMWHWRNRGTKRLVLVYNVFAPHALPVLAARILWGGWAIPVIADLPHGIYGFSGLWGRLQRLDIKAQTGSISRFDGQIALTRMIVEDFAPHVPALLLEGGVDTSEAGDVTPPAESERRIVLFSGTLSEVNGTRLMLDAFSLIEDPAYSLQIFGRGPLEDLVIAAATKDSRVEFRGFQPNAEILRSQRQATVLLNPRPTDHPITKYTFPSKLLEYMLSGRPVITTRLAGISDDYFPHLFILEPDTPQALAHLIERVCSMPEADIEAFGRNARQFVLRDKSWAHQGERVFAFLQGFTMEQW
jgi:glycosyltransferase involved in cell wall biosynthesis